MTDGGKPVYSRFGDEIENSTIFATLSAIVTKFSCFISTDQNKEELNVISNENSKIVFLKKGQLIFISISKKNDSVSLLITQLEFLYQQLMSILTIHFYEKLEDNPSKCLTAMSDTEILFEQMIQYTKKSMVSILNSFQVLPFENREQLNKICELNRGKNNQDFNEEFVFPKILDLTDQNIIIQKDSNHKFYLCGIITHLGESGAGGHFIAYCRNSPESNFLCYNDAQVSEVSIEVAISSKISNNEYEKKTPYILLYHFMKDKETK